MVRKYKYVEPEVCKQAIIFARVSSNKQELGASIEAQVEAITNYCQNKNFVILAPKQFIITESSTRGDRKLFNEMLDFVRKQKHKTAIVVHCIDRLQRGFDECTAIRELLRDDKIEVHFYKEGLILHKESSTGDIARWDFGILSAKMYIGSMQENVKRSQRFNRAAGKWQGLAPIGYLNAKDENRRSTLIVDPERAPIIKRMFEEYATGRYTLKSIWHRANEMGLISKEKNPYKKSVNFGKYMPISRNKVYDILTNHFYYGLMIYHEGKYITKQVHHIYPPLITKKTFDEVQAVLKKHQLQPSKEQEYGGIPFTFRNLVKCSCGCAISSEHHLKNGKEYIYLRCSHLKGPCNQKIVNETVILEQLDKEIFSKIKIAPELFKLLKQAVLEKLEDEKQLNDKIRKKVSTDLNALDNKLVWLKNLLYDQTITQAEYKEDKAKIEAEKVELQKRAERYADITKELKDKVEKVIDVVANISNLMKRADPRQKCTLLGYLLEDCVLKDRRLTYRIKAPFDKFITTNWKSWHNLPLAHLNEFEEVNLN